MFFKESISCGAIASFCKIRCEGLGHVGGLNKRASIVSKNEWPWSGAAAQFSYSVPDHCGGGAGSEGGHGQLKYTD